MADDVARKEEQAFGGFDTSVNVKIHGKEYGVSVDIPKNSPTSAKPYVAHIYQGKKEKPDQDLVNVAYATPHDWRFRLGFGLGNPEAANTAKPTVSERQPRVGMTLTAEPGKWIGASLKYDYQWRRSDGTKWVDIGKGPTYKVTEADKEHTLQVAVTASRDGGDPLATANSDPTDKVPA
jgi:hypothetical protein